MSKKYFKITVEGIGQFPYDMLRYDQCFPFTETDSANISLRYEKRQVTLRASMPPTRERWQSFMWRVVEVDQY